MIHDFDIDVGEEPDVLRLMAMLSDTGLVKLNGISDRGTLLELADRFLIRWHHRDSDPDGITVIRDMGEVAQHPGFAGLGHDDLPMHTESSAQAHPPQLMLLHCAQGAAAGGDCQLVDGARLHAELLARDPDLLRELSSPRSALFGALRT